MRSVLSRTEPTAVADVRVRDAHRWLTAVPAFVPALVIAVGGWEHRWMDEDAFINLRIVDQIFAGHGPVFNAAERIEAATSPLWLAVLVVARTLFGWAAPMEWVALVASLVTAVGAFAVGGHAARVLHRGTDGVVVPVGLLLVAAVKVVWDFSTSGLEMGLVWLWLAGAWLALVTLARSEQLLSRQRFACAFVLGVAPLVRPDLGIMMLCLIAAWFWLARPRRILFDLTAMFALPVAYEIFRMGYYATVVPNTALAKDAGGLHIGQGWSYATDFIVPYLLWVSAAIVVATVVGAHRARRGDSSQRGAAIISGAMVAASLFNALYIVAIGGDYMHGRLLLPAFFALGLPASIVVHRRALVQLVIGTLAAAWAVFSIVVFRPPHPPLTYGLASVADWRAVSHARIKPYDSQFNLSGNEAHAEYVRGVRGFFGLTDKQPRPAIDPHAFVIVYGSIGVPAYNAGHDVFVVDIGGLAEPLAARSPPIAGRAAGHRKQIDDAWYVARFGAEQGDAKVLAARRALTCGPLPGLLAAVDGPMTFGRFFSNLWHSVSYTRLRVPYEPRVAEAEWCTNSPVSAQP